MDKQQSKKGMKTAIIAVISFLVIGIIIAKVFFGGKMSDPMDDAVKYANEHEFELANLFKNSNFGPAGEWQILYAEYLEELSGIYDSDYDDRVITKLEEKFGEDYELTYEIIEKEVVNGSGKEGIIDAITWEFNGSWEDLKEMNEEQLLGYCEENELISATERQRLEKQYSKIEKWVEKIEIDEVYELKVEFTIKGEKGEDDFTYGSIVVAKVNGQWMAFKKDEYDYEEDGGPIDINCVIFTLKPYDIVRGLKLYVD